MAPSELTLELSVSDLGRSLDFYVRIIGYRVKYTRPEKKFAFLQFEKTSLMIEQDNGHWVTAPAEYPRGRGLNLEIGVTDIDPIVRRLRKNKIPFFEKPHSAGYRAKNKIIGVRQFLVQDPDGYLLRFQMPLRTKIKR